MLSIIIPVFNEEKTVGQIVKAVFNSKISKLKKEVIIVDDGSSDKTFKVLKELNRKYSFKLVTHEKNLGKGAAVRNGIKNSGGEIIIIQDADLEYDPNDYAKLVEPIIRKKAKVVYGTRLINYPLILWGKNKTKS